MPFRCTSPARFSPCCARGVTSLSCARPDAARQMHDAPPGSDAQVGRGVLRLWLNVGSTASAAHPISSPARTNRCRQRVASRPGRPGVRDVAARDEAHLGDTRATRPPIGVPPTMQPLRRTQSHRPAGHESAGAGGSTVSVDGCGDGHHHTPLLATIAAPERRAPSSHTRQKHKSRASRSRRRAVLHSARGPCRRGTRGRRTGSFVNIGTRLPA